MILAAAKPIVQLERYAGDAPITPPCHAQQQIPGPLSLVKVATGTDGFDEITGGGSTWVCGGPGCGKTLFALQLLVHGAAHCESGLFVTFEETEEDVLKNAASLGYDVPDLIRDLHRRPA